MSQASIDEGVRRMSVHDSVFEDDRNANNSYSMMDPGGSRSGYQMPRSASGNGFPSYSAGPSSDMGQPQYGGYQSASYYDFNQRPVQAVNLYY